MIGQFFGHNGLDGRDNPRIRSGDGHDGRGKICPNYLSTARPQDLQTHAGLSLDENRSLVPLIARAFRVEKALSRHSPTASIVGSLGVVEPFSPSPHPPVP